VLDRHHVDTGAEGTGGVGVVGALVPTDPMMDLERVRDASSRREQDSDLAITGRRREVVRERGDAATTGRVG
jgi:hypothetical protein